jgi:S1-C subfamily serine protease
MKTTTLLAIAAACLTSACTHAQQPTRSGPRTFEGEVVDIPQPPATAYLGLQTVLPMPTPGKPIVVGVERGSPAAQAGFMVGDTLVLFDGRDPVEMRLNLRKLTPGAQHQVTVRRGGDTHMLVLVPGPPRREN